MNVQEGLLHILENYLSEKRGALRQNNLAKFLKSGISDILLKDIEILNDERYISEGSAGMGRWAEVPWICILNRNITTSAQRGIYLVFLFSSDMERVYLSLNQGFSFFQDNKLTKQIGDVNELIRGLISNKYKKDGLLITATQMYH